MKKNSLIFLDLCGVIRYVCAAAGSGGATERREGMIWEVDV